MRMRDIKRTIAELECAVEGKRAESDASADRLRQALARANESIDVLMGRTLVAPIPAIARLDEERKRR